MRAQRSTLCAMIRKVPLQAVIFPSQGKRIVFGHTSSIVPAVPPSDFKGRSVHMTISPTATCSRISKTFLAF
jgi:hypothetical protein